MKFLSLELSGYKSWGHPGIEFKMNQPGVNQIAGRNASGKTNLIEGPFWVLTGKQIKDLKVDKVVNGRHVKKGAKGALTFEAEGHVYRVERYRKHPQHKNGLFLFKDNAPVETPDPQIEIDKIIGMTAEELLGSIFFKVIHFRHIYHA